MAVLGGRRSLAATAAVVMVGLVGAGALYLGASTPDGNDGQPGPAAAALVGASPSVSPELALVTITQIEVAKPKVAKPKAAKPTAVPKATAEPRAAAKSKAAAKPASTPEPTTKPKPKPTVEPTAKPTPTADPTVKPTATPKPTAEPTPTIEPTTNPTAKPEPVRTPELTAEPSPKTEVQRTTDDSPLRSSIVDPTSRLGAWVCDGTVRAQDLGHQQWSVSRVSFVPGNGYERVVLHLRRLGPDGGAPASVTAEAFPTSEIREHVPGAARPAAGQHTVSLHLVNGMRGTLGLRGYRPRGLDTLKEFSAYQTAGNSSRLLITVGGEGCFRLRAPVWNGSGESPRTGQIWLDIKS